MSFTKEHIRALEEIVELNGSCLDASRCPRCPFIKTCLPTFIIGDRHLPPKSKRFNMALDILAQLELIEVSNEYASK